MKTITLAALIFIISLSVNAERICEEYITDEWPDSRYTIESISEDNVVTDKDTKLMWKQCSQGLSGSECMTGVTSAYNLKAALELADAEEFAGYSDWRLPNIKELQTLVARNCFGPILNETTFPNTSLTWYWSSTAYTLSGFNYAWVVNFYHGQILDYLRTNTYPIRLVRTNF